MRWLFLRVLEVAGMLLAVSALAFIALHAVGNPADLLMSPGADAADRQRFIEHMGLDAPLWLQYLHFIRATAQGDLGVSFVYNVPAIVLIGQRAVATLELAGAASLFALSVGVPLGFFCGLRPRAWLARVTTAGSVLGFSLPTFWVGLVLILVFSVHLGWLPSSGRGGTRDILGMDVSFLTWDGLRHLALPALNLSLFPLALVFRMTRAQVIETMHQDFVRYARARGLSVGRILGVHVARAIALPVLTASTLELGAALAFSVVTETIFAWPGMGKLIIDSINLVDRPVIVTYLMLVCMFFLSLNLAVDLFSRILDPRLHGAPR